MINYILKLFKKLKFCLAIMGRAFIILFRRKQGIQLLHLDYGDRHLFENSYIIIRYRFRNALWYRFGGHKTLEKEIKIFNLKNFEKEFDFVVYGLFRKKTYKLKFQPELSLNTQSFKTHFQKILVDLEFKSVPNLVFPVFICELPTPEVKIPKIKFAGEKITIQNNTYNQTDFI